jgi:hypothetical protein
LLRQIDHHMARLRSPRNRFPTRRGRAAQISNRLAVDVAFAERIAAALRRVVRDTAQSSAADRARVRAAVHYFVLSRDALDDRRPRGTQDDVRVVNEILLELGRPDLLIS